MKSYAKIYAWGTVVVSAAVVALLATIVMPYMTRGSLKVEVDRNSYPVKGIDVSHHNGSINFAAVKKDSVQFVMIKATDGVGDIDPNFIDNYRDAKANGLDVGAYHYFRYHRDGKAQAESFLEVLRDVELTLPVAIDVEDNGNRAEEKCHVAGRLRDMIDRLKDEGHRVMVYVNPDQYAEFIDGRFDDVEIWFASSREPSRTMGMRRLWQHSHFGKVAGIEGFVDLNTFNGSVEEYLDWIEAGRADTI